MDDTNRDTHNQAHAQGTPEGSDTAIDTHAERLRAWQAMGYADSLREHYRADLWRSYDDRDLNAAYQRGLAGEPPPCGCDAQQRLDALHDTLWHMEADQRGWLAVAAHTTILVDAVSKLRAILRDDWTPTPGCQAIEVLRALERRVRAACQETACEDHSAIVAWDASAEQIREARAALGDTEAL